MEINISRISNSFNNKINSKKTKEESNKKFIIPNDPVAEGICKNVKDPIDREEDLMLWENLSKNFKLNNNTYEEFKKLKNSMIGFPPPSAPGRVQRQYREYMEKLPKDVRDKIQGILTFTYAELVRNKTIDPSNWSQVLKLMKANVCRVGDLSIGTGIVEKCLDDFCDFNKEQYKTVYNNATLNNSSNKSKNELSDDEINKEVVN